MLHQHQHQPRGWGQCRQKCEGIFQTNRFPCIISIMFQFVGTFSVDVDVLARKSQSIQNNLSVLRVSKL